MADQIKNAHHSQTISLSSKVNTWIISTVLTIIEIDYDSGKYPEAPWIAALICNNHNYPLPPWAISYFASIAENMIIRDEPIDNNYGAYLADLFGGIDGDKLKSVRKEIKDLNRVIIIDGLVAERCSKSTSLEDMLFNRPHGVLAAAIRKYEKLHPSDKSPRRHYERTRKKILRATESTLRENRDTFPKKILKRSARFEEQLEANQKHKP